ncbi:hypothetical protein FisN_10Hu367 [Fistulifera solaris]|uniref:Uncharacterized protein n=1 Tax=Fistulifera solaris TaxID=1519565 RepID=A0A1Z5JR23_FISSO|nr:hypothetical protein FisN_10Hu367 [Fistulifera solaris]|eukprot:GAX16399.1 hypothetical protein FisN_10Hu367 [Fistulifera solaris]
MKPVFKQIPEKKLTAQQERLMAPLIGLPLFRWRQEPTDLKELFDNNIPLSIWRDNGTVIFINAWYSNRSVLRCLSFDYREDKEDDEGGPVCLCGHIVGDTDEAIAETATFFWSLKHPAAILRLYMTTKFDMSSFRPEQLTRILDNQRNLDLQTGSWSTEQAVVLATRPHPLHLRLGMDVTFSGDNGTAFAEALETRTSTFGYLHIETDDYDRPPLSQNSFKRLLQLEGKIERLRISLLKEIEMLLLPMSAQVDCLEYDLEVKRIQENAFDTLSIAAKHISLTFFLDWLEDGSWYVYVISFFDRLAQLGHVESLSLSLNYLDPTTVSFLDSNEEMSSIARAVVGFIQGNPRLKHFSFSDILWCVDDEPHLPQIFEAMEDHPSLRTVMIQGCKDESDDDGVKYLSHLDYNALRQLLSRNRNIEILDFNRKRISDGARIDELYKLNLYYNHSLKLLTEKPTSRSQLVSTALIESASGEFPQTAVLIAHHLDLMATWWWPSILINR